MRERGGRRLAVVALAAMLVAPGVALACRCVPRSPAQYAADADAVIVAEVAAVDDRDPVDRLYRARALRSWKLPIGGMVTIRSEATTCQADFTPGRRYLVYLKRTPGGYRTDACSGNLPAGRAAAAMAKLGRAAPAAVGRR